MHPSRRRKKRPNYGFRTVEVMRSANGFGFTISGQQPCILSCIVANSPADQAGLRAGDFLISVNGVSVSKITHDAVVSLIGNCGGPIKMTIAENYYSDSSEEELECGRMVNNRKPRYMHKPRPNRACKGDLRRVAAGGSGQNVMKMRECISKHSPNEPRLNANVFNEEPSNEDLNVSNPIPMEDEAGPIEYKALVGYLGTIEMPNELLPNSRLQIVCSCIRKLRQEKRSPTAVLMTILPTCLTLKNASNHILAIYPTNRVVYVGSSTEKESRYFGIVTSAVCDSRNDSLQKRYVDNNVWQPNEQKFNNVDSEIEISNSCHVFVTDPKITDHTIHLKRAENFKISCTTDPTTGLCLEFPMNALQIVSLIQNMYKLQNNEVNVQNNANVPVIANSPQPSASSNSDSGIGFRDDCGNISDRILVVEFPAHRPLPVLNNSNRPQGIDGGNLPLEALDIPLANSQPQSCELNNVRCQNNLSKCDGIDTRQLNNLNNIRACEGGINIKNHIEKAEGYLVKQNNDSSSEYNRLTCRAILDSRLTRGLSPASITSSDDNTKMADVDTGQIFAERPVDCPKEGHVRKSEGFISQSLEDLDFKSSADNISVHSSKSLEFANLMNVFRVPFEIKKSKKQQKNTISCDNLDEYKENMNYKLSPKVYGMSKTNYSCEELNNLDQIEKIGYGSLQDLSNWQEQSQKSRTIAQSEPDVRIQRDRDGYLKPGSPGRGVSRASLFPGSRRRTAVAGGWSRPIDRSRPRPVAFMTRLRGHPAMDALAKAYDNLVCHLLYHAKGDGREGGLAVTLPPALFVARRRAASQRLPARARPASLLLRPDVVPQCEQNGDARCGGAAGGPAAWAAAFEKLLEDPYGLHAFADFLKKEFSAENIYFWTACERHRRLPAGAERAAEARRIRRRHLAAGAPEPVNVDARARLAADRPPDAAAAADDDAFDLAQKQIFNLMKFDSYPRFLKSDVYARCLAGEMDFSAQFDAGLLVHSPTKLKKSLSNAEDRRRKSLLPWHRKNRSKSKDREEGKKEAASESHLGQSKGRDDHSSRSSLTSLDLAITSQDSSKPRNNNNNPEDSRTALCRVLLSNGSTTVVQIKEAETIHRLVSRLLEKRGLNYSSFEVYTNKHPKAMDVNEPSTKLAGCEVTVEQRVVFKLDLPNRKIISVKSKYTKVIIDVLRPILHKYNYNLEQVNVSNGGKYVDLHLQVTSIDGARLNIQLKNDIKNEQLPTPSKMDKTKTKLEEITNKVFEGILQEKADSVGTTKPPKSDKGSVKSEDWGSEHSSGIFGKFLRRDSGMHERKKKLLAPRVKCNNLNNGNEESNGENQLKKPLIAKWKVGATKFNVSNCSESDELVEGLTRAQRRLEDQRGTEINFELPDFLKDKENEQNKSKAGRRVPAVETTARFYLGEPASGKTPATAKNPGREPQPNYENRNVTVPCESTRVRLRSPGMSSEEGSGSNRSTPAKGGGLDETVVENGKPRGSEPPPLPPKPKIVPIKPPNWGQNGFYKKDVTDRNQPMFLEQPSSSFV